MIQPEGNAGGLTVGSVLGETYELVRLIGQGGMGAVWEASHLRLPGKRVAVKVLLATISAGSEAFTRFRREAEIASRLGHPNIVEVIDFNVLPSGAPYLVLELLQGENLASRLRRGPIPPAETMAIVRQIGAGLSAAHRHGVVHRDLKPDNVFLCPAEDEGATAPRVKVLDFGISKITGSSTLQTQEQRVMGTPQYMAPEQAKGQNSSVDARADVFALGTIVYEMLAGRSAFSGENLAEVVFKVVYEQPTPLAQLSPGAPAHVLAAVERALAKEAVDRWPDIPTMIEALTGRPLATIDRGPPDATAHSRSQDAFAHTVASQDEAVPPAAVPAALHDQAAPTAPARPDAFLATVESGDRATPAAVLTPGRSGPVARAAADKQQGRGKTRLLAVAATVLLGGGVGAWLVVRGKGSPEPAPVAAIVPTTASDAAPVPTAASDAAPVEIAAPDAAPAPVIAKKPPAEKLAAGNASDDEPEAEDLGSARQFLDDAQAALAAGKPDEAVRLARRSLNEKRTVRAFSIIARAYCKQGDLGNAKAQLGQLPARERQRVIRSCRRHGVELL